MACFLQEARPLLIVVDNYLVTARVRMFLFRIDAPTFMAPEGRE